MEKYCYADGKIIPLTRACLPVNDLGLLRGYSLFDFLWVVDGKPFHYQDHFARFKKSARFLNLLLPKTAHEIATIINQLVKKNKCPNAGVRLVLTGGPARDGLTPTKPTFYILLEDRYLPSPAVYQKGGRLITYEYHRSPFAIKHTNYLTAVRLQKLKKRKRAIEILYTDHGQVLEATTSNIFLVSGGQIITPKVGILPGITRKLVLHLARQAKLKTMERAITIKKLLAADEVFITATNKKIVPIVKIDNQPISLGRIGPITRRLMDSFDDYLRNY
ncbi:MAG: aminotransferase class IV [Candidatus Paceibacterota bacterium]